LANEEVIDGKCERCGSETEKREKEQWMLAITKYAERLHTDLDKVDYLEKIKIQQRNWIGRSEGATIKFPISPAGNAMRSVAGRNFQFPNKPDSDSDWIATSKTPRNDEEYIEVFTTRVDTLFGCTYVVVAPEHPLIREQLIVNREQVGIEDFSHPSPRKAEELPSGRGAGSGDQIAGDMEPGVGIKNWKEVVAYIEETKKKSEMDRTAEGREKTGVRLEGIMAVNPINGEEVPVFVADYVLGDYGTGAVMAVPAHDTRDFAFAKKYDLPIRNVIMPHLIDKKNPPREGKKSVERNTIHALVRNPKDGRFLCLEWKQHPWTTFIVGGVEDGEDVVEAAKREVLEETGFSNLKYVKTLGGKVRSEYFAAHKDENRVSNTSSLLFELVDETREQVAEDEVAKHSTIWLSLDEIRSREMACSELNFWLERLEGNEGAFVDDGALTDSSEFSGLSSEEAREKITVKLESEGSGKKVVKYKLRDWVFSRQRYWGEPIPVVHCETCAAMEADVKLALNFREETVWNDILSGKKTVETRALNPDEPDRYFGDVAEGDSMRFVYKQTGEAKLFRVKRVYRFADVAELFAAEEKDLRGKIFSREFKTVEELETAYAGLSPDYAERISKNGMVGWEIEPVKMLKAVPLPESALPLELPEIDGGYSPTDTGESPLAKIESWVNTICPTCGGPAKRETDTMPNWAGSSWYFLRYIDPKNDSALADPEKLKRYMPVDWYNGGMEHTTLHLLYSRFWNKFLYDIGVAPTSEPYQKRTSHGLILAEGGVKMSKSKGNVINPDDIVSDFGADTLRIYEMFMGPFDQPIAWGENGLVGSRRFLERVWKLSAKVIDGAEDGRELLFALHGSVKKVSEDIEALRFNTAVSSMMILVNAMEKEPTVSKNSFGLFLRILSPFAPHIAEELWAGLGNSESLFLSSWPIADPALLVEDTVKIVVSVNGKVRDTFEISADATEDDLKARALAGDKVAKFLDGQDPKRVIVVPGKLVNIVV
jgi:leucyl-tRNA synthetase